MYAMAVLQLAQALRMGNRNLRRLFELLLALSILTHRMPNIDRGLHFRN